MKTANRRIPVTVVTSIVLWGCGELVGVGDLVGGGGVGQPSAADSGSEGQSPSQLSAQEAALVLVDSPDPTALSDTSTCAGTLLSNDWVLTAGHCIPKFSVIAGTNPPRLNRDRLVNPESLQVRTVESAGDLQTSVVDRYYFFGGFPGIEAIEGQGSTRCMSDAWDAPDLALLHLANPFIVRGARTGYELPLFANGSEALVGRDLSVFWLDANGAVAGSSASVIERAPDKAGGARLSFGLRPGDVDAPFRSSGPDFVYDDGRWQLASIHTGHLWKCSTDDDPATCSGSEIDCPREDRIAHEVVSASISELRDWISEVRSNEWTSNQDFEQFTIHAAELRGQPEAVFTPESASWGIATRVAERMCWNRSFAGGYFDGRVTNSSATNSPGYELTCFTRDVAVWKGISASDLASTGNPITTLDGTNWAPADRGANALCRQLTDYAPAHFGGGYLNQMNGMFCLRSEHTEVESMPAATPEETNSWFQSGQAATEQCLKSGCRAGLPDGTGGQSRGVLCFD